MGFFFYDLHVFLSSFLSTSLSLNHLDDTPFHFYYYSKAEFIIYKLKLMRRITQRETLQIAKEFDLQDTRHFGKLTLNDILNMEAE